MSEAREVQQRMDRNLALEAVRVTEAGALAASRMMGRGDKDGADQAAVDATRRALNSIAVQGTVVIGEGERDEAPMLYIGEEVGTGDGPEVDVALDPLEGTETTAKGGANALAVVAMAEKGGFLHAPDCYMEKLAVGPGLPDGLLDLDDSPQANLKRIAEAKGVGIEDLVVCILERARHETLIRQVREAGARISLIRDGDVSAIIATTDPESLVDCYMGVGAAPEGVLSAAALRCTGGQMKGRLVYRKDEEKERAQRYGIEDLYKVFDYTELASGNVMFAATGVTPGHLLRGVRRFANGATTHSVVMRSKSGTVRTIEAEHNFRRKAHLGAF